MMPPEEEMDVIEDPEEDFLDEEPDEIDQEYVNRISKLATGQVSEISHKHKHTDEFPDSISIGTDGKGGNIKCYGNAKNIKEFISKFDNMIILRQHANDKMKMLQQEPDK